MKLLSSLLLSLLQILRSLSPSFPASAPSSTANSSDAQKLLSFKSSLLNPNILQDWKRGTDPCLFTGVFCNNSRVTSLNVNSLSLSSDFSSVSAHLFSIDQLTSVALKSTNISGPLQPFSLCSPSLAEIDLSENSISGPFSDLTSFGSCSGLKHLNLSSNLLDTSKDLKGSHFGLSLETLDYINLSDNNLSGSIPSQFANFSSHSFEGNYDLYCEPLAWSWCPQGEEGDSSPSHGSDEDLQIQAKGDYFYVGLYVSIGLGFYAGFCAFFATLGPKDSWRHRYSQFLEHIITGNMSL